MAVDSANFVFEIAIDEAGSEFVRVTCSAENASYGGGFDIVETATLCETVKSPGTPNKTGTFSGVIDDDAADPIRKLIPAHQNKLRVPFRVGPLGDTAGLDLFSGYGYISPLTFNAAANESVKVDFTLGVDGLDVLTTWPS